MSEHEIVSRVMSGWFDTHCHPELENLAQEIDEAKSAGLGGFIVVGTDLGTSERAVRFAEHAEAHSDSFIARATIGMHPHDAKDATSAVFEDFRDLLRQDTSHRIVGVGECGLDYFYDHSPRDQQRQAFVRQIELAREWDRTLVIHTRDAWSDTFEIMESEELPNRIVFHCFIGGEEEMRRAVEIGAFISFSGIVTFKNSEALRSVARSVPLGQLLVETDAPYLAPVPLRGTKNAPRNVVVTGEFVAQLREIESEALKLLTWENALRAFAI
ncbi:MAG: TatD family hydrolase [Acidimicrobiales bacterium]